MEKVTTAMLFEICSFLQFKEMIVLKKISKHYYKKMHDILVIFSEREAQRLLFSKWTLLRNPFIEQEQPKTILTNGNWYEFLKSQVETRRWLMVKMWNVLPNVFGEYSDDNINKKLINKLIMEIKKPSESPPKLMKTNNSVALRTSFQELLYCHYEMRRKANHQSLIENSVGETIAENDIDFVQEIVDNDEQIWLRDFRWYRNKLEVAKTPKSSILCMLFCLEGFIRCHWEVAHKVIQTKTNTDTFLDEYGTRWVSYSDLIMTLEDEFYYLETAINNIYDSPIIEKEKFPNEEFIPKYSIFRMMWRIWGKYVMKRLLPAFQDKIKSLLGQYHKKWEETSRDYSKIMKNKFARTKIKSKISIDHISRDLLLQSVQMIVDVSLNEISINYIESTWVQMGIYYPKVEQVVLKEWSNLFDSIKENLNAADFQNFTKLYFNEIKSIFPKTTQRKLRELIAAKQIGYLEEKITKLYDEFLSSEEKNSSRQIKKLKSSTSLAVKNGKVSFDNLNNILGNHQNERIATTIKQLVLNHQSGNGLLKPTLMEEPSVSDDEETKDPSDCWQVGYKLTYECEKILTFLNRCFTVIHQAWMKRTCQ
jgi:hypothetical protein